MRFRRLLAALAAALALAPASASSAGEKASPPDAGVTEATQARSACEPLAARLARRKAWLATRRQEQFERGGPPDPARGISNAVGVWCEAHPGDEECALGNAVVEVRAEELAWDPAKTPEDYDARVVVMARELAECRAREARRR